MLEELGREKLIISNIYQSEKAMTSYELSDLLSVSVRTIKSDMVKVRLLLEDNGAQLISIKHKGYEIKVNNLDLFDPFINQIIYNRIVIDSFYNDKSARFIYIARELVASDEYIKIDDLADQMYLSRSSIKTDMQRVYSFLNSFHIDVDTKPGQGIKAVGTEANLRMAMTELVVNHYHQIHVNNTSKKFAKVIQASEEERQKIRRAYLKVYRESGHSATDSNTLSFAFYLLISKNRIKDYHLISLSEEARDEAKGLEEYNIAIEIANALLTCEMNLTSDDELAHMAIMLHGMRDLTVEDIELHSIYQSEAEQTVEDIIKTINSDWEIDFKPIENFKGLLKSSVTQIIRQIRFGLSSHQTIGFSQSHHEVAGSPLSIELGRRALRVIEDKYYCRLNTTVAVELSYCFFEALSSVHYPIKKMRLLTTSAAGKKAGNGLVERINTHFREFVESNAAVELYEIRGVDPKDCDWVVLNSPDFSYFYDIPSFHMSSISKPHRFTEMFNDIFVNAYQFKKYVDDLNNTQAFRQFKFESISSFFKLIAYKHGTSEVECQQLETMLEENEKFLSYDILENMVSIFLPANMCKDRGIEIYEFNEARHWNRGDVLYAVIYIVDFNYCTYRAKAIENISRAMIDNKVILNDLMKDAKKENYCKLIKISLTAE